ncbi:MAG: DeoR/GlpR family DNA-binding transcription regulator [Anaerorhabdus sp.]
MLKVDRQNLIEKKIKEKGSILISNLVGFFDCSLETIRRDLIEMEKQGRIIRTFGGAYIPDKFNKSVPISLRSTMLTTEKNYIAKKAINHISDCDVIFLDSSSTCASLANEIANSNIAVTIITNSTLVIRIICDSSIRNNNVKLVSLGGEYKNSTSSLTGQVTLDTIDNFIATKSFISCPHIDAKIGLTDNDIESAYIRKAMIKNSTKTIVLADHTKLNNNSDVKIVELSNINHLITDKKVDIEFEKKLRELNISLEY